MVRWNGYLAGLCLALCLLSPPGWSQDSKQLQKIERTRAEMKEARDGLDQAEDRLVEVYQALEKEFDRIGGQYALPFLNGVEKAWLESLDELKAWWSSEGAGEKGVTKRRFLDYAAPQLERSAKTRVLDVDSRVLRPLVDKGAEIIYNKLKRNEALEPGDMENALADILSPGVYYHHYWNDFLFLKINEAKAFARAHERLDKIRVDLDRLEHPEKYTAKGELAPSGMVYIPGSNYSLGPNTGWEKPRRKVNIREFYIDKYEVTNKEYRDFLKSIDPKLYTEYVPYFWPLNRNMEHYYPEDRADHPVMGVSWMGASEFARWRGKRLPTEEEWEVAARGKQNKAYPWGNRFEPGLCNTREAGINGTTEVGNFPGGASPFGCMDMAGNVWEWTATDQEGNRISEADNTVRNMVIRGGDFKEGADHARCDFRWMTPMDPYAGRHPSKKRIGFRCVKSVK